MADKKVPIFSVQDIEEAKRFVPAVPKFSPKEIEEAKQARPEDIPLKKSIPFAVRSAVEGHTAGISEPVISGAKARAKGPEIMRAPPGVASDIEMGDAYDSPEYKQAYAADVAQRKEDKAKMPGLDASMQIMGAIAPSPLNVGTRAFKLGESASKLTGLAEKIAALKAIQNPTIANRAAKLGLKVVKGGSEGLLGSVAFEGTRQAALGSTGFQDKSAKDTIIDIGKAGLTGGAVGAAIPVAGAALVGTGKAVAGAAKGLFRTALGVSKENVSKYLADPKRINSAKSLEEIKNEVDSVVGKLTKDVSDAKVKKEDASTAFKSLHAQLTESFRSKKVESKEAKKMADSILMRSFEDAKQELLANKPTAIKEEVLSSVAQLREQLNAGSSNAKEILSDSSATIPAAKIKGYLQFQVNQLNENSFTDASQSAVGELQRMRDRLDKLPKNIPLRQAKALLQDLDRSVAKWGMGPTDFNETADIVKKNTRGFIDERLKGLSPKYKEAMIPVAEDAALLSQLTKAFGNEAAAISTLNTIKSERGQTVIPILRRLSEKTGNDLVTPVEKYLAAQSKLTALKSPQGKEKFLRSLPEYSEMRSATAGFSQADRQASKQNISQILSKSKENRNLGISTSSLNQAEQKLAPFRSLAPNSQGASQVEPKLRALMTSRGIENRRVFDKLSKLTGNDFAQAIDDLRVKESFQKGQVNASSRNVNLFGAIGAAIGAGIAGSPGAFVGGGAGAALGKYVDSFGPAMAKEVLDQVIKLEGTATVQKIRSLRLPDNVKSELEKDLQLFLINSERPPIIYKSVADQGSEPNRTSSSIERKLEYNRNR